MNFIAGVAKLLIIIFYLAVLMLASNQHGKAWKGNVNFWVVFAIIVANLGTLTFGGFFDGFFNFTV